MRAVVMRNITLRAALIAKQAFLLKQAFPSLAAAETADAAGKEAMP